MTTMAMVRLLVARRGLRDFRIPGGFGPMRAHGLEDDEMRGVPSNPTAPGNGAMALLFQSQHLRRAVPEQYR